MRLPRPAVQCSECPQVVAVWRDWSGAREPCEGRDSVPRACSVPRKPAAREHWQEWELTGEDSQRVGSTWAILGVGTGSRGPSELGKEYWAAPLLSQSFHHPVSDPPQAAVASPLSGPLVTTLATSHSTCPSFGGGRAAAGGRRFGAGRVLQLLPSVSTGARSQSSFSCGASAPDTRAPSRRASLCPRHDCFLLLWLPRLRPEQAHGASPQAQLV